MFLLDHASQHLPPKPVQNSCHCSMSDMISLSGLVDRDDGFRMPPPAIGRRPKKLPTSEFRPKTVLDEESYVDALSQIIERDYFPETSKLRRHLELLNAHDRNDTAAISVLRHQILTEHRKSCATPSSSHGQTDVQREGRKARESSDDRVDDARTVDTKDLSIDNFFSEYTSEDNESFASLQTRDLEKWRQARHWAYENTGIEDDDYEKRPGMLMLYHMGGKVLTGLERKTFDALLDIPKSIGDDKPSSVDTWNFRVRNNLMFPPTLADSQSTLLLENTEHSSTSSNVNVSEIARTGDQSRIIKHKTLEVLKSNSICFAARQPKIIQRLNTSLRHRPQAPIVYSSSGITPSPLEPAHSPSVISDYLSESSSVTYHEGERIDRAKNKTYRILNMTPSPMPGGNGESPMMTWGVIDGTPLILDPPESQSERNMLADLTSNTYRSLISTGLDVTTGGYEGSMYQPPAPKRRELLAHSLAAKEKSRKAAAKKNNHSKETSSSSGHSSALRRNSIGRSAAHQLTPAALSLATRLMERPSSINTVRGSQGHAVNPFSSSALTQSYTSRPADISRKGKNSRTVGDPKRDDKRAKLQGSDTPRTNHITSMNTDNLLHLD